MPEGSWVSCQIGAREQYAVPRILRSHGMLRSLITDVWAPTYMQPLSRKLMVAQRFLNRFHPDLAQADVRDFKTMFFSENFLSYIRRCESSTRTYRLNRSFAENAGREITDIVRQHAIQGVFAYSYAALDAFEIAKRLGLSTILGQIDAGPFAEEIYDQAYSQIGLANERRSPPPKAYWGSWRKECALADLIVVNSQWSKRALEREHIPADKIKVIPVAFDTNDFGHREKSYESIVPPKFSSDEPLKVIFIGSASVEKGIHHLLQAAHELIRDPVLFQIIGSTNLSRQLLASAPGNVQFFGSVPRGTVRPHLERAHLLLFPSLSDGFGIVQLEAHASGLPVLASANCGDIVVDGQTGLILTELNHTVISDAIRRIIQHPEALVAMSRLTSNRVSEFSLARVGRMWMQQIRSMQSMEQLTQ